MNKRGLFLLAIAFAVFLAAACFAHAQDNSLPPELGQLENAQGTINTLTNQDITNSYLAQEWTKYIENNPNLKWIFALNPIFVFLFGYPFALSWAFFVALIVFIGVFALFYPPMRALLKNSFAGLGVGLAISVIACHYLNPIIIADLSSFVKNIWYSIGTVVAMLFLIIFLGLISSQVGKAISAKRAASRINKLEKKEKELEESEQGNKGRGKRLEEIEKAAEDISEGYRGSNSEE